MRYSVVRSAVSRFPSLGLVGAAACIATASVAIGPAPAAQTALVSAKAVGGQNLVAPIRPGIARRNTGVGASSFNWAGYVQAGPRNTYTGVTATFLVTTVDTSIPSTQYSSDWVGIGGYRDAKLVQAGIEADNLDGTVFYRAWTEIFPRTEDPLSLAISPGDIVTVTVKETANKHDKNKRWSMTVDDVTTGASAGRTVRYKSSGASVEAIHERPCISFPCSTHLGNLATTTNESFDPAYFSTSPPNLPGTYRPLLSPANGATLYDLVMVANNDATVLATPSNANSLR